jgi:prolyl-tRNA synthetase
MRLSRYFLPTLKETPAEAQIVSHRTMLRAGMVRQSAAGIYTWLPLGLRVLRKVERIVREEQDRAGALEILMPTLQAADLWKESGRYEAYGKEMLRMQDRHERELVYGPTAEEVVTDIFRTYIRSYKDLPKHLYQIGWKFRDEIRPRFGVMRGREFLMKDNYSFDLDFAGAQKSYDIMYATYLKTFARMGLRAIPVAADPGAIGGNMSHEFQILAETGESQVYYDSAFDDVDVGNADPQTLTKLKSLYAAADEKHNPESCPVPKERLKTARGIEVGHIFYFGTKYSKPMGAVVTGPNGDEITVEMGSYGIGVSRLVGAIIEASHDDNGAIWPDPVAPFDVGLINLKPGDANCDRIAEDAYAALDQSGREALYDDKDERAGVKFARMDLIGLPWQMVIGPKGAEKGVVELKRRKTGEKAELSLESALARLTQSNG